MCNSSIAISVPSYTASAARSTSCATSSALAAPLPSLQLRCLHLVNGLQTLTLLDPESADRYLWSAEQFLQSLVAAALVKG